MQAFAVFDFAWHYALPVTIFAYCYSRILYVVRRQKKVVSHPEVSMAAATREGNVGQTQQQQHQSTGATTGTKLSRTQLNVLQTMLEVIICFIACWTPSSFANIVQSITVWNANEQKVRFKLSCLNPIHTADDATPQLRRVGVGGVYWALSIRL